MCSSPPMGVPLERTHVSAFTSTCVSHTGHRGGISLPWSAGSADARRVLHVAAPCEDNPAGEARTAQTEQENQPGTRLLCGERAGLAG